MKRSYSRRISPVQLLGSRRFFQSDNKQLDPSVHSQHSLQEWTEDKGRLLQKPTFTKEDWFEAISLIEDQEKRFPASEKGRFVEGAFALLDKMYDEAESNEHNYLGNGGPPYNKNLLIEVLLAWREHVTGASVEIDEDEDLETESKNDASDDSSADQFSFSISKALTNLWNFVAMDENSTTTAATADAPSVKTVLERTKRLTTSSKLFSNGNNVPFNIIMTVMKDSEDVDNLMEWMRQQEDTDFHPTHCTLHVALSLRRSSGPAACESLLQSFMERVKSGDLKPGVLRPKHFKVAIQAWGFSKNDNYIEKARLVYEMMPMMDVQPDRGTLNTYMMTLASEKGRRHHLGEIEALYQTVCESFQPSADTFQAVLTVLTSAVQTLEPEEIRQKLEFYLFEMEAFNVQSNSFLENSITTLWSRLGDFDMMEKQFAQMKDKGIVPKLSNHRTRIVGWSKGGNPEKTQRALKELLETYESGIIPEGPDVREFNAVIQAWTHAPGVDSATKAHRAEQILRQMEELARTKGYNCQPDSNTYSTVISLIAACEVREVRNRVFGLAEEMKAKGIVPQLPVGMGLMKVHGENGNPDKGEQVFQDEIKTRSVDSGFYFGRFNIWLRNENPDMCARSLLDTIRACQSKKIDLYPSRVRIQETIQLFLAKKRPFDAEKFLQIVHEAYKSDPSLPQAVYTYHVNSILSFYRKNRYHMKGAAEHSWRVFQTARTQWLVYRGDKDNLQWNLNLLSYVEVVTTLAESSHPAAQEPLGHLLRELEQKPADFFRQKSAHKWLKNLQDALSRSSLPQKDEMLSFYMKFIRAKRLNVTGQDRQ